MHATATTGAPVWILALLAALTACGPETQTSPAPVLDLAFAARVEEPLATLAARVPLAPDQEFRIEELGRSDFTSHHVGAIRTGEELHRHDRHDQLVVLVRGRGTMRIGDEVRSIGAGSVTFLPRGVPHAFTNAGVEPSIAYLVYAPAFDGKDRVLVGKSTPTP